MIANLGLLGIPFPYMPTDIDRHPAPISTLATLRITGKSASTKKDALQLVEQSGIFL
jgi:hypothetical protein